MSTQPAPSVPEWLKQRVIAARAEHGKAYHISVTQGFLEVPDWAYHLRDAAGGKLIENAGEFEKLFEAAFEGAMRGGSDGVRIIGGARAEHYVMVNGFALSELLTRTGLAATYGWRPDEAA